MIRSFLNNPDRTECYATESETNRAARNDRNCHQNQPCLRVAFDDVPHLSKGCRYLHLQRAHDKLLDSEFADPGNFGIENMLSLHIGQLLPTQIRGLKYHQRTAPVYLDVK